MTYHDLLIYSLRIKQKPVCAREAIVAKKGITLIPKQNDGRIPILYSLCINELYAVRFTKSSFFWYVSHIIYSGNKKTAMVFALILWRMNSTAHSHIRTHIH